MKESQAVANIFEVQDKQERWNETNKNEII
jgi:hypothetical protein